VKLVEVSREVLHHRRILLIVGDRQHHALDAHLREPLAERFHQRDRTGHVVCEIQDQHGLDAEQFEPCGPHHVGQPADYSPLRDGFAALLE